MSNEKNKTTKVILAFAYTLSFGLHGVLAVGAAVAPAEGRPPESVAVVLQEIAEKHKTELPPPPPPPPPRPPPPKEEKPREEAKPEPEPEAQTDDAGDSDPSQFEDLGLVAGNSGGPGVAVAMNKPREKVEAKAEPVKKKVATLGPKPGDCSDPPVKPRALRTVKPKYNEAAVQAEIEGIIRVEALIDEAGRVLSVRVLKGLGHGLDEAAIEAVQAMEWAPAMQCGKPVKFPFAFNIRFALDS